MSDKANPPLRLFPLDIPDVVVSMPNEVARLFEAGTASGNGGSRDDGVSTPALGTTNKISVEYKYVLIMIYNHQGSCHSPLQRWTFTKDMENLFNRKSYYLGPN